MSKNIYFICHETGRSLIVDTMETLDRKITMEMNSRIPGNENTELELDRAWVSIGVRQTKSVRIKFIFCLIEEVFKAI